MTADQRPIEFWWYAIDRTMPCCSECGALAEYRYARSGDYTEYGARCSMHVPRREPDPCTYRDGRGRWCCAGCVLGGEPKEGWLAKEALAHLDQHEAAGHGHVEESRTHVRMVGDSLPHSHEFGSAYRHSSLWRNDTDKIITMTLSFDEGERMISVGTEYNYRLVCLHTRFDAIAEAAGLTREGRSKGMTRGAP